MVVLYDCTCMVVVLRGLTIHVHQKIVYVSFIFICTRIVSSLWKVLSRVFVLKNRFSGMKDIF